MVECADARDLVADRPHVDEDVVAARLDVNGDTITSPEVDVVDLEQEVSGLDVGESVSVIHEVLPFKQAKRCVYIIPHFK